MGNYEHGLKKHFNNQDYFEDFITRSTYHSNAIEGNAGIQSHLILDILPVYLTGGISCARYGGYFLSLKT